MHSDAADALLDLVDFCDEIMLFAAGKDSGRDDIERMRYLAIERLFELVGECLKRAIKAEPSLAKRFADTPQVIGMRNRIAHEYDAIDPEFVWDTAFNDIPLFVNDIRRLLAADGHV
ncbi:MAG: DUF86 domain-containing protein [Thermomicrobiales bacterium]|nr:DUF86 domain-containing protein [Thermomicrobiales bacterium]MCO5223207.1 DUF86 domain-containing protein [Thermomicrobiales bacterium]